MKYLKKQKVQKQILNYLLPKGFFVYKNNNVGIYFDLQFVKKSIGRYIPAKKKGVPDLTAIKDGEVYMIEVKTRMGKQSLAQLQFQIIWEQHGGRYILGGMDEVMKFIR